MGLIDFILNVAGVLLWFNWRAAWFDPLTKPDGSIRRKETSRFQRWLSLAVVLVLVCGRAFFYRLLGPAVDWTANLNFGAITLFFRTDQFWLMLLYSSLSFARALVLAYFWLLAVCIFNRSTAATNPTLRLVRRQLGSVAAWPIYVQVTLPLVFVAAAWPGLHVLLTSANVTNPLPPFGPLIMQAALIGSGIYFSLKYLIPVVLLADLIARYVFFGSSPFWEFLSATARNLLAPLQRLPLRAGKVDFTPLVGIILTLLLLHGLPHLIMHELHKRNLTLWPQ